MLADMISKQAINKIVKSSFRKLGIDVQKYSPNPLFTLFQLYQVDTIFDIGANIGMSAETFRSIGFQGKIVSFEPVKHFFNQMNVKADLDRNWSTENIAIGNVNSENHYINVTSGHGGASSILEMSENLRINAPDQEVLRQEVIRVKTLDSIIDTYYPRGNNLFLKIDVQGYEKKLIEGAILSLPRVIGVKIEMSLVKNYEDEILWMEMYQLMHELGFRLVLVENAWHNALSKELYQIDGTFFRTDRFTIDLTHKS